MKKGVYAGCATYFIPEAEFRQVLDIGDGPEMWRVFYDFANNQVVVQMDTEPPSRPWNILHKHNDPGKENQ